MLLNHQRMSEYSRIGQSDLEEGGIDPLNSDLHPDRSGLQVAKEEKEEDDGSNGYTCRICLEDQLPRSEVIAPCACRGSSKWVHRACLDRWRSVREDKAFSRCTECLQYYQLICLTNDTCQEKCLRRTRFSAYVCKDVALIFITTQFFILLFSWIVYSFDANHQTLLKTFGMESHPLLLYYLLGLFITCSLVGMIGTCVQCQICGDVDPSATCYCGDLIWIPYFSTDTAGGSTCLCCPTESCSSITCAECGSCGSCECGSLCAGAGEEMLYLLIVLLVLFAIVGVFIFIFVGIAVIQQIIQKHIHILDKWNLTREYIVKDLAPGAIPITLPSRTIANNDLESNHPHPSAPSILHQHNPLQPQSQIELSPYSSNREVRYRGIATTSSHIMERELSEGEEEGSLPEPSAPPMTSLDFRQREELIRRGLL